MTILLISSDLACVANVSGAAKRAGHALRTAMRVAAIDDKLDETQLVIVDLNTGGVEAGELVPRLRAGLPAGAAIWAFAPHVHESKLAEASAAGCDRVLARGQFYARLDALLAECG